MVDNFQKAFGTLKEFHAKQREFLSSRFKFQALGKAFGHVASAAVSTGVVLTSAIAIGLSVAIGSVAFLLHVALLAADHAAFFLISVAKKKPVVNSEKTEEK